MHTKWDDANNWQHRLSTLENLMVQIVAAMTKTNALTNVVENTKDKEDKVAKVPCMPTRMIWTRPLREVHFV
jgi:hypothetical protein